MTEIKIILYNNEIEMLKDFMDPKSDTGIDSITMKWDHELHTLLSTIGQIVTEPGFDILVLREQYEKKD